MNTELQLKIVSNALAKMSTEMGELKANLHLAQAQIEVMQEQIKALIAENEKLTGSQEETM